ncbi:hypothetical protein ACJX0J_034837, partial [Zea mays]
TYGPNNKRATWGEKVVKGHYTFGSSLLTQDNGLHRFSLYMVYIDFSLYIFSIDNTA